MCYLVAKKFENQGCIAVKARHGKALSKIVKQLNEKVSDKGIQLVTISRPSAYGEYEPYEMLRSIEEFESRVLKLS